MAGRRFPRSYRAGLWEPQGRSRADHFYRTSLVRAPVPAIRTAACRLSAAWR